MSVSRVALALLAVGCHKNLLAELPDADVIACGKPPVFVNLDGVTIDQSSDFMDDAKRNHSGINALGDGNPGTVILPPPAGANEIRDRIVATLTALRVQVVTTRPTSGEYTMVVVVDDDRFSTLNRGSIAVEPIDCNNASKSSLSYINAMYTAPGQVEAITKVALGVDMGLELIAPGFPDNCMDPDHLDPASLNPDCGFADGVATIHGTPVCTNGMQDQLAVLAAEVRCP